MFSTNIHNVLGVSIGPPLSLGNHKWQVYTFHLETKETYEVTAYMADDVEPLPTIRYIPKLARPKENRRD